MNFTCIKEKELINSIYNGNKIVLKNLVIFYKKSEFHNRFLFVVSKKIGKAVIRNKIKRRLKNIINDFCFGKTINYDFILLARAEIYKEKFINLKKEIIDALSSIIGL